MSEVQLIHACVNLTILFNALRAPSRIVGNFAQTHTEPKITHRHTSPRPKIVQLDQQLSKMKIITSTNLTSVFVVVVGLPPNAMLEVCCSTHTEKQKYAGDHFNIAFLGGGGGTWCEATTEVKFVVGLTTYNVWLYARNTTEGRVYFPTCFRLCYWVREDLVQGEDRR